MTETAPQRIEHILSGKTICPLDYFSNSLFYDWPVIAYDRIQNEIPAENVVLINVPDPHLRKPLEDIRFASYFLIVGRLSDEQKKRINSGVPVILRGEQTGRIYYGGSVSLRSAPNMTNAKVGFKNYLEQARRAYEDDAGVKFPAEVDINILLIQKLVPMANTRLSGFDIHMQSIKVPKLYFDALAAPRLASFQEKRPLTGLVIPVSYSMQNLEEGKPIRFCEIDLCMGARPGAEEGVGTGHIYEAKKLHRVMHMKVRDLYEKVGSGEFSDAQAQSYGFSRGFDLWEKMNEAFRTHGSCDPGQEDIYLLEFDLINVRSWAYFNPPEVPEAAFTFGGEPVPPSAYCSRPAMAANDNAGRCNPN